MSIKSHKITYFGEFVRVNPLWYDDEGEIVRDALGLTSDDPDEWSVETAYRDPETGMLLWYVEGDFDDPVVAGLVAAGALAMTVSNCGPGGSNAFLCYRIVSEPEHERAFADWVEWGGPSDSGEWEQALEDLSRQLGQPVFADLGVEV